MGKLIVDGKNVYEVDEACMKRRRVPAECKVKEALQRQEEKEWGNAIKSVHKIK